MMLTISTRFGGGLIPSIIRHLLIFLECGGTFQRCIQVPGTNNGKMLMDPMIGYCGLDCRGCPIHVATVESNEMKRCEIRADVARFCRERYGLPYEAGDINDCDGCHSERLFVSCARCEIRKCAAERSLTSCAYCDQYACERLQSMFLEDPAAHRRLEVLRGAAR